MTVCGLLKVENSDSASRGSNPLPPASHIYEWGTFAVPGPDDEIFREWAKFKTAEEASKFVKDIFLKAIKHQSNEIRYELRNDRIFVAFIRGDTVQEQLEAPGTLWEMIICRLKVKTSGFLITTNPNPITDTAFVIKCLGHTLIENVIR